MQEDFEALDRWRAGDREAGNELLSRHFDRLYRFFANKVDQGIDDLIQRTFLACIESRDRFRKQASFRTYLFAVARHELYRHIHRELRDTRITDVGEHSVVDLGSTPSRVAAARQEHRLLLEALRRLPLDLQVAVELFYWENLSTAEIAEVLGVPRGTAKSRLRRAREQLEAQMRVLCDSQSVLESTLSRFEHWARGVREAMMPSGDRGEDP